MQLRYRLEREHGHVGGWLSAASGTPTPLHIGDLPPARRRLQLAVGRAADEVDGGAWCGGFAIDRVTGEAECVVAVPVPVPARDASANAAAARRASLPLKEEGLAGADGAEPPLLVAVSVEVRAAAPCPCGGGCNPIWWWLQPDVEAATQYGGSCSPMWGGGYRPLRQRPQPCVAPCSLRHAHCAMLTVEACGPSHM